MTRKELYQQVWEMPMSCLAQQYGISDVALAKRCRKLRIPVPGRGYWRKLEVGQKVRRTPLPPGRDSDNYEIVITRTQRETGPALEIVEEHPLVERERRPENRIMVAEQLVDPHKEVALAERSLRSSKSNERGHLVPRKRKRLDIRVTEGSLDRALRIADALVKALVQRGLKVSVAAEAQTASTPSVTISR